MFKHKKIYKLSKIYCNWRSYMFDKIKEKIKKLEESAKLFVDDTDAQADSIDIGKLLTLIIKRYLSP